MNTPCIGVSPAVLQASRALLARAQAKAKDWGGGVWRTTEDGSRIFISGSGEVRAGGPGGKVVGTFARTSGKTGRSKVAPKRPDSAAAEPGKWTRVLELDQPDDVEVDEASYRFVLEQSGVTSKAKQDKEIKKLYAKLEQSLGEEWYQAIPRLVGAPNGAKVIVGIEDQDANEVSVYMQTGGDVGETTSLRKLFLDNMTIENAAFDMDDKHRGQGLGSQMFNAQVQNAVMLGFNQITTEAARSEHQNGYYTWARLGYDAELDDAFQMYDRDAEYAKERITLRDEATDDHDAFYVSDLMKTQKGRDWWKKNGVTFEGKFDLSYGSQSRRVLDAYVAAKTPSKRKPVEKSQRKAKDWGGGVWRTSDDGEKIFIKDGEARGGGPAGPVLGKKKPKPKPTAKRTKRPTAGAKTEAKPSKPDKYAELASVKRKEIDKSQAEAEARLERLKNGKPEGALETNDYTRNPKKAIENARDQVEQIKKQPRELTADDKKMADMMEAMQNKKPASDPKPATKPEAKPATPKPATKPGAGTKAEKPKRQKPNRDPKVEQWARSRFKDEGKARNFSEWFGESKVVDEDGKPKMVFHGTADFEGKVFQRSKLGTTTGAEPAKLGFWFSDDTGVANDYSKMAGIKEANNLEMQAEELFQSGNKEGAKRLMKMAERIFLGPEGRGEATVPVYLSMQNPLVHDAGNSRNADLMGLAEKAKAGGHDGLIVKGLQDSVGESDQPATHYLVFNSEEIKSAHGNQGTFSRKEKDITKSLYDMVGWEGSLSKSKTGGVWRTTDDGNKIFISNGGEVRAGGPGGPVIGGPTPKKPAARKPRAKKPAAEKPKAAKPTGRSPGSKSTQKAGNRVKLAEARHRDSLDISEPMKKVDDVGKSFLIADLIYVGHQYNKDVEFVNERSQDVSAIRKKLLASDNEDFYQRQEELVKAIGKKSKTKSVALEKPDDRDFHYENRRADMAAKFVDAIYDTDEPEEMKVIYQQGRSHYSEKKKAITMDPEALVGVYVHEMGHAIEKKPGNLRAARAMLFTLTKDSEPVPLSDRGFDKKEVSHGEIKGVGGAGSLSKSAALYAGKTYGDRGTEIVSTGLQQLHDSPKKMAKENPVYFDFMINLLQGNYERGN